MDTQPIPVVPTGQGRRARASRLPVLLLAVLVAVLATTTAVGFLRPTEDPAVTAEIARLRQQVTARTAQLDAAKRCIAAYEAQRKEQAGAIQEAADAIGDARDAIGSLARLDLGGATRLAGRAGQRIGDASRRLATADRSTPQDCTAFVK